MKIRHYKDVDNLLFKEEGASKVSIRWLIGEKDNPPNFYLRMIEVEPGGYTPYHKHSKEHEVFVLEGEGKVVDEGGNEYSLKEGIVVYIPPMEKHQFRNNGNKVLKFLCIIPKEH